MKRMEEYYKMIRSEAAAAKRRQGRKNTRSGLLANAVFRKIYAAYAAAAIGDWFDMLAIQVLVGYRWQASPLMLSLIPVSLAVPGIVLGSLAGVAADRLDRLKLMRLCDLLTAAITAALLFAPGMLWLLPLLALRSAVSALNVPAQQSLTRSIVREDQLLQAASLNGLVTQGSKIAGPLLGGAALAFLSPAWCIGLNALLRLFSFGLLLTVRSRDAARSPETVSESAAEESKPSFRMMWKEGWGLIWSSRMLRNTLLFGLLGALTIQMVDYQFTSLFRMLAPDRAYLLGWMIAAAGAGAVMIMLLLNRISGGRRYGLRLGGGYVLIGAAFGGLGLLQPGAGTLPVLLLGLMMGAGNGLFFVSFSYCLQKETPPSMTGRVFGIQSMMLSAVMVVAPLLGGVLVGIEGPRAVFAAFGLAIGLLGGAGMALGRRIWPEGEAEEI